MRTAPLLLSSLVLAGLLTGCSDDESGRRLAADEPTSAPSSATPTAAPSAQSSTSPPRATATTAPPSAAPAPATTAVRLTGDGIDTPARVVVFGDAFAEAEPALRAALGAPTLDTGEQQSFGTYGTCPGTRLRALEFGGGALHVLFGDVQGSGLTMYQWSLTRRGRPAEVPEASALVGDVTTFEFAVGDTVGDLRAGSRGARLEVRQGDEVFGPSFTLDDQSSGFLGYLTGTADSDTVTGVQAGTACGE